MNVREVIGRRLRGLLISRPRAASPADVVRTLVAVQSQDYAGATWSLGLRCNGSVLADVERDFNSGAILRTHVLRPTWHFVAPDDIRWLLELTGPRVMAQNAGRMRQLGITVATIRKSHDTLARALEGKAFKTRDELREALQRRGIETGQDQRMAYLLMTAELDGIICSGPRRGKQFTYALLAERAPKARTLDREEALAELARRFFTTRGPATPHDLAKWAGLTIADAKRGLAMNASGLDSAPHDGRTVWFPAGAAPRTRPGTFLLSIYDEYLSSYRFRGDIGEAKYAKRLVGMGAALQFVFIVNGKVMGTWRREVGARQLVVRLLPFRRLAADEVRALERAAGRYGTFLGLPPRLV